MARTPGALNRRTRAALSAAAEGKLGPHAEKTIKYLLDLSNDPSADHATRIQAANAALQYVKPKLAAIEQTTIDERDKADPAEIEAKLVAMLTEKPEMLERIVTIAVNAAPELRGRLLAALGTPIQQNDTIAPLTH